MCKTNEPESKIDNKARYAIETFEHGVFRLETIDYSIEDKLTEAVNRMREQGGPAPKLYKLVEIAYGIVTKVVINDTDAK